MNTYGTATVNRTRDIVTAIHVMDVTCCDIHTGCIAFWKIDTFDLFLRDAPFTGIHIGHTTAAIHRANGHIRTFDSQHDTIGMRHGTLVTARIDVTYQALLQMPGRTDGHRGFIVTAKDTGKLVTVTVVMRGQRVDTHRVNTRLGNHLIPVGFIKGTPLGMFDAGRHGT